MNQKFYSSFWHRDLLKNQVFHMKHLVFSISHHQLNTQQMTIDFITFLSSWLDKWGHQLHIEAYFCTFYGF
ncbi:hypothetical protein C0134_03830 [Moraxella catarrhalis]|nr:hypothetical protein SQ01_00145 [Moraxella catarrhalis]MPW82646.1 hypothetical protein [Moraxella catarrhalis]